MPAVQLAIAGGATAYFWFELGDGSIGNPYKPGNVGLNAGANTIGTVNLGTIGTAATATNQSTANGFLGSIDGKLPPLGQTLASGSLPVVLTAAQLSTLTPLTSITANLGTIGTAATESTLSAINTKFPPRGQALAADSVPIVLTAAQLSTLTPLATVAVSSITNIVPVGVPRATTVVNASQQTNATGATYNTLASYSCYGLEFFNNTGTVVEYRRGGAGVAIPVFNNSSKWVTGITNANEISIRRVDTSGTQVTIAYEVYS
jgi:hypothetical protein